MIYTLPLSWQFHLRNLSYKRNAKELCTMMFTAALFIFDHATAYRILVPRPVTEFVPSAVEVWSPNLWTAREFYAALLVFF